MCLKVNIIKSIKNIYILYLFIVIHLFNKAKHILDTGDITVNKKGQNPLLSWSLHFRGGKKIYKIRDTSI